MALGRLAVIIFAQKRVGIYGCQASGRTTRVHQKGGFSKGIFQDVRRKVMDAADAITTYNPEMTMVCIIAFLVSCYRCLPTCFYVFSWWSFRSNGNRLENCKLMSMSMNYKASR